MVAATADDEPTATEEGLDHGVRKGGIHGAPTRGHGDVASTAGHENGGDDNDEMRVLPGLEGLTMQPPPDAIRGPSGWIYHETSLWGLGIQSFPRNVAINIIEAPWFEPAIALTIIANISVMAWNSPVDPEGTEKQATIAVSGRYYTRTHPWLRPAARPRTFSAKPTRHNRPALQKYEHVFLAIFTCELVTKIIGYGFVMHKYSYLRDPWCILDFLVVSLAWCAASANVCGTLQTSN